MVETAFYDNLAESYDLLISWKARLRRERPFFRRLFREFGVRRILDTACGTGIHAIAFHDWGYHVVGSDISPAMVEKSRANAGERQIEFVEAGFGQLDTLGGLFDAVTCLGNSLPHVLTDEELDRSLASMRDALLPGGVLVIHGNNYDRILGRRERFMPLARGRQDGQERLFLRFFDFHGDLLTFNLVTLARNSRVWESSADSSEHRALTRDLLTSRLVKAGFTDLRVYGSFYGEEFRELDSDNLIVTAQKPHTAFSRIVREPVAALDRIPILENGEPMVDIEDAIPGILTRTPKTYVRATVAEMLRRAQSLLPEGYRLRVNAGYRSLEHQNEIYQRFYGELAGQHPEWPASQLRRTINRFLAPPDAKHPPGHTTGGAVDVVVVGPDGEELDANSTMVPVETPMPVFTTYSKLITPRAAKHRQMLLDVMTTVGFSNYSGEWWHYSYGDSGWALRTGAPHAVYGAVEAP